MSEPLVLVEAEGPILVVTINRPEKKNAANAEVSAGCTTRGFASTPMIPCE
jgi:enoyl-CoA hydratase/carnithine racemase